MRANLLSVSVWFRRPPQRRTPEELREATTGRSQSCDRKRLGRIAAWGDVTRFRRGVVTLLLVVLLLGAPATAAAECRFVRAPIPQPSFPHPVFPGCFVVLVGWLICYARGGVPTPDDPPGSPTVVPVEAVFCHSGAG